MAAKGSDIAHAAARLRAGELVAIPTETVYGLAANATNPQAVEGIFTAKQRPTHNPLILHFADLGAVQAYVAEFPPAALALAKRFWPGPLTLLLPKRDGMVLDIVNNGLPVVAVRVPAHPMTLELLRQLDFPVAAPSANPFGYISPTTAGHVESQLGDKIAYILDGGPCPSGIESTIVRFENGHPVVLRHGAIPLEAIEEVAGNTTVQTKATKVTIAPGMLASHYSPRTPLVLVEAAQSYLDQLETGNYGALVLQTPLTGVAEAKQMVLSSSGNLVEAAQNLYAAMHFLDSLGLDLIVAELLPQIGLGAAINDRLSRASTPQ